MAEKNLNKKFVCPEGYEECAALELFSNGMGIYLDKTGDAHAILSNDGEYMGEIYCTNPLNCIKNYVHRIAIEQKRKSYLQPKQNYKAN